MSEFGNETPEEIKIPKRTGKKRYVREDEIEHHFCKEVAKAGGLADKFKTPGRAGGPDRIVYWPHLPNELVELKTIGGRLEGSQVLWHRRYTTVTGKKIPVLWTIRHVDEWIAKRKAQLYAAVSGR